MKAGCIVRDHEKGMESSSSSRMRHILIGVERAEDDNLKGLDKRFTLVV